MRSPVRILTCCCLLLAACGITACGRNAKGEGPMERSGKAVDKAAKDTGEAVHEGVEKTGEATERAGEKMQGK
jgi:hypothetical protein